MTPAPRVAVLDYGSGNLHSATRALSATGADVILTSDVDVAAAADGLVVPGVGAYAACMSSLRAVGGDLLILERVRSGRPLLGICVGHQILFGEGVEHGVTTAGVGIWPGTVGKLSARRLPHMGWNEVHVAPGSRLFSGVSGERFYFVHSYAASPSGLPQEALVTTARHESAEFVAAVEWGAVSSTQFHPEKSGAAGQRLLANWVSTILPR